MLDWTDAQKQAFQSGTQKYLTLTFSGGTVIDNELIQAESMSLTQTICDEQELKYGLCYASMFSVVVFVVDEVFKGQTVAVQLQADSYTMNLGTYLVVSCPLSDDRTYRTITAYDALYNILQTNYAPWIGETFDFPITMGQFRNAFFNHIGITQVSATLVNDNTQVLMIPSNDVISGADILRSIGEINGVFGHINYDGQFKWVGISVNDESLYPALTIYPRNNGTLIPTEASYYTVTDGDYAIGTLVYGEGLVDSPTKVSYTGTSGATYSYGTDGVEYQLSSNILLTASTTNIVNTALSNLYTNIAGISYIPATVKLRAAPWVEVGDSVLIVSRFNDEVRFPVMNRTMTGITGLTDGFSAYGNGKYTNNPNSASEKRNQALTYSYLAQFSVSITPSNMVFGNTNTCTLTAKVFHSGIELTNLSGFQIVWSDGVLGQTRTGVPINATYTATLERV